MNSPDVIRSTSSESMLVNKNAMDCFHRSQNRAAPNSCETGLSSCGNLAVSVWRCFPNAVMCRFTEVAGQVTHRPRQGRCARIDHLASQRLRSHNFSNTEFFEPEERCPVVLR